MFLALDDDLLFQYFAFQEGKRSDYQKETIIKLFKYLQPFTISIEQKDSLELDDDLIKYIVDDGFITIASFTNEDDLIQSTKLKVMLTKDGIDGTYPYPYINILKDEIDVNFTATYKGKDEDNDGENRDKAIEHIKALLLDANEISIYDRYLSKINYNNDSWTINKQTLLDILPQKLMTINIYCEYNWTSNREDDLTLVYTNWTINKQDFDRNMHDRYIETDKVIILLSSGIINLASTNKDFTYIIKIKKEDS